MRRLSTLALLLALAAAAPGAIYALPAEGDNGGAAGGDAGAGSDTGATDPIKATSGLIDAATDATIVANTNLATGAAQATQAVGGAIDGAAVTGAVANAAQATQGLAAGATTTTTPQINLKDVAATLMQAGAALPKPAMSQEDMVASLQQATQQAKTVKDLITTSDLLKKVEGFAIKLDAAGCYDLKGPQDLSLKICEDDAGARKALPLKGTPNAFVSWVNGTIVNTGTKPVCDLALASPNMDLVNQAVKIVPKGLPITLPNALPTNTIDLAPAEKLPFALLLPFDNVMNTPALVGLADTLKVCDKATKKLSEPAGAVAAATTAAAAVTTEAATAAVTETAAAAAETVEKINKMEDVNTQATSPAASRSVSAVLVAAATAVVVFVVA